MCDAWHALLPRLLLVTVAVVWLLLPRVVMVMVMIGIPHGDDITGGDRS